MSTLAPPRRRGTHGGGDTKEGAVCVEGRDTADLREFPDACRPLDFDQGDISALGSFSALCSSIIYLDYYCGYMWENGRHREGNSTRLCCDLKSKQEELEESVTSHVSGLWLGLASGAGLTVQGWKMGTG